MNTNESLRMLRRVTDSIADRARRQYIEEARVTLRRRQVERETDEEIRQALRAGNVTSVVTD